MSYFEILRLGVYGQIVQTLFGLSLFMFSGSAYASDLDEKPIAIQPQKSCKARLNHVKVKRTEELISYPIQNSPPDSDVKVNFNTKLAPYLKELHSFIRRDKDRISNFDFLTTDDFQILADILRANRRLSNQIAIQVTTMERKGMIPKDPTSVVRALVTLSTISNGYRYDFCNSESGCNRSVQVGGRCIAGSCTPKVNQEFIFGIDNQIHAVWHFEFPVHLKLWDHELILWERRELEVDENSQAIRTLSATGGSYLTMLLNAAKVDSFRKRPWVFIYMDLNNLGLINYFNESHAAGDAYIKAFSKAIHKHLTPTDHFFRIGGDEFVIVGENRSADTVQPYIDQLIKEFFEDIQANHLFHKQWKFISDGIRAIPTFKDYEQLTESPYIRLLEGSWLKVASTDWNLFLENYQTHYESQLTDKLLYQKFLLTPTFSVGSKIITPNDTIESLKEQTSFQSALCKRDFKEALGDCAEKYGGAPENRHLQRENIELRRTIQPHSLPPL